MQLEFTSGKINHSENEFFVQFDTTTEKQVITSGTSSHNRIQEWLNTSRVSVTHRLKSQCELLALQLESTL